ncbi:thiamine pyrophosphate-binding protein [Patescibacteria group bacterium]|nr:MAG: thiamine pyrophosphate-binding protein [Patescibacteria group bacterium]
MMNVSEYIADFLVRQGIGHVFVVTGGAVACLIDSVAKDRRLAYVCTQHEQAAAFAVDGYTRVTGKMGAAIVTTGPGVTNLATGVANLYYDSLPSIFIAGQVSTFRLAENAPGVRQLGFQEAPHVELMRPITKYAVLVADPSHIRYELEKALYLAVTGRPGPVFLDIPDDVQRMEIDPERMAGFEPPPAPTKDLSGLSLQVDEALRLLAAARRPIVVLGAAVKIARQQAQAIEFVEKFGLPTALTWAVWELLPTDHPLQTGGFGVSSTRRGNFAIQNADFVLSVGSRLDTHATGTPIATFAREAKKVIVELDAAELNKFMSGGMRVDVPILSDVRDFFVALRDKFTAVQVGDITEWRAKIAEWRERYPVCLPEFRESRGSVNPYVFLEMLSEETAPDDIIIPDCGGNLIQTYQGYRLRRGQRIFSAFNNSPMGYSLSGSIGACFANGGRRVICITGDGGLQVNIQELGTVAHHHLPIKIFLFNNHGYGIIQQTQDDWYGSRYIASRPQTGLADPDYVKIAEAYGIRAWTARSHDDLRQIIRLTLAHPGPALCNMEFSQDQRLHPMLKAGRPIEDPNPLLPREQFFREMLVKPLDSSLCED